MKLSELLKEHVHLDMDIEVREGDVLADMVVLVRTASMGDLSDALIIGTSDGCGGIVQYGIVCSAKLQLDQWMTDGGS